MLAAYMEVGNLHSMLDHQIDRGVWKKGRWGLVFVKRASYFEAKKAINHELEAHGYGGGEEKDKEDDDGVCVWCVVEDEGKKERMIVLQYL